MSVIDSRGMNVERLIREIAARFEAAKLTYGHGTDNATDEAAWLVFARLGLSHDDAPAAYTNRVSDDDCAAINALAARRIDERVPLAYLVNQAWFAGLEFYVDERVLVPRSPIAELISNHFEPWIDSRRVNRILDLCTGSGCIAIAAKYQFPEAEVCASDVSADALEVAGVNLEQHELGDHIVLYESDLFDDIPQSKFDVIVTNPPYVDTEDMDALSAEFKREPALGLRAGEDGLQLVDRILARAGEYLSDHGILIIEVGNSQAALEQKYDFLPMTWIDFEFGGGGVCCIQAQDLKRQQDAITAVAS